LLGADIGSAEWTDAFPLLLQSDLGADVSRTVRSMSSRHEVSIVPRRAWEPENMQHLDMVIDILKSELHDAIRDFVSDVKGCMSGARPADGSSGFGV
jgi:hypothetical protein